MQAMSAPAQAFPEEVEAVALPLAALMRHLVTETGPDFFKEVERLDLTFSQVKALNLLSDRDLTIKGLSDVLGLSLPGVSRAVEGLVKRGLVRRTEDPADRRSRRVSATAKGRATMEGLIQLRLAGVRRFVADLDPDQRAALGDGLRPLMDRPEISALPMSDSGTKR